MGKGRQVFCHLNLLVYIKKDCYQLTTLEFSSVSTSIICENFSLESPLISKYSKIINEEQNLFQELQLPLQFADVIR